MVEKEIEEFTLAYPEDQEVLVWQAESRAQAGDRVGAIRVLRSVLDKQPDNLPAVTALALNLAHLGLAGDAIGILENYVQLRPEASDSLENVIDLVEDVEDELEDANDSDDDDSDDQ